MSSDPLSGQERLALALLEEPRMTAVTAELVAVTMSMRARCYLWATAVPSAIIGLYCVMNAPILSSPSYSTIGSVLPFPVWGVLFLVVAAVAVAGAVSGREVPARLALVGSAFACAMWAGGFGYAYFHHRLSGPTGILVWGILAVKDLIVCRQPLRSPFEALSRIMATARER